jgi:hypothetical protein
VDYLNADVTHHEDVTILNEVRVGTTAWPRIGPIRTALSGEIEVDRSIFRELLTSADKVSVDVGLGDRCYPKVIVRGELYVLLNVSLGIDNERFSRFLTSNEVGVLGEVGIEYLTE